VGQFGKTLLLDSQLIVAEFSGLSQKFFTLLFTPTLGQLGGTVWDIASAWLSIDCNGIFGSVPKVFHLIVLLNCGTSLIKKCLSGNSLPENADWICPTSREIAWKRLGHLSQMHFARFTDFLIAICQGTTLYEITVKKNK